MNYGFDYFGGDGEMGETWSQQNMSNFDDEQIWSHTNDIKQTESSTPEV